MTPTPVQPPQPPGKPLWQQMHDAWMATQNPTGLTPQHQLMQRNHDGSAPFWQQMVKTYTGKPPSMYAQMQHHYEVSSDLRAAIADIDSNPTDEQRKAGNFKKGHFTWKGLPITVELASGQFRRGTNKHGKSWETKMTAHYGYIKRTESEADGEHIDVFIGPELDSEVVFVVNQIKQDTGKFDEHKCVLGCRSSEEAKKLYLSNYSTGWKGYGSIASMTLSQFKQWIDEGDTSKEAIALKS